MNPNIFDLIIDTVVSVINFLFNCFITVMDLSSTIYRAIFNNQVPQSTVGELLYLVVGVVFQVAVLCLLIAGVFIVFSYIVKGGMKIAERIRQRN